MCGIAGEFGKESILGKGTSVPKMIDALTHRGPDDKSFWYAHGDPHWLGGLGMCRLSIIDREHGKQPFGRTCKAFFNGEIYNHQTLRRNLRHFGEVSCETQCDSEVVAKLYERNKEHFIGMLRGMYAIAIWDEQEEKLKLYRDRVGKKPLHYYHRSGVFLFASEIKAILTHPAYEKKINKRAIWQYLCIQYVPEPMTAFEGIMAIPPGGQAIYDPKDDMLVVEQSRAIECPGMDVMLEKSKEDLIHVVRATVDDAVRVRLESEVPLGVYLSGGIDSAIITAIASEHIQDLHTFTMGFLEDEYDETAGAQLIADRYGTNHHHEIIDLNGLDLGVAAQEIVDQYDQPFGDCSAIPTMLLARLSKKYITVALSGDGGDEAFGGYVRYWEARPNDYWQFMSVWPPNRRAQLWPTGFLAFADDHPAKYVQQYMVEAGRGRTGPMYSDIRTYLLNDIIVKMERASMAASVEARCPFLDPAVLDLGLSLNSADKLGDKEGKLILKKAFADRLPPQTLAAPKRGFSVPMNKWLREPAWIALMGDTILAKDSFGELGFDRNLVAQLVVGHINGDVNIGHALWVLMMLDMWLRRNF